ncbi:hypothetical protein RISK_006390 [Rhodopirellula islandica]|uniref:Transmembrane protein n=1 Tax=Rhodopirellula islandica TaxID=595434 RepID=A0A0J1B4J3_RHOIS|nr:hypothetical protein [Rhodopirellula islandica]KLU01543.1 hypothetical protein RISK_006390 [Rhodopirellula islandica]
MPSEPNPYSVAGNADNHVVAEEPRTFLGGLLVFIRVALLSIIWMIVFFFAAAVVLGFLTGIYISVRYAGSNTPAEPSAWISIVWMLAPQVIGVLGLVLGLLGKLPGTRR